MTPPGGSRHDAAMPKTRPESTTTLKRQRAGSYATPDARFLVEQASGGWMVTDAERTNELGLPLVRGPFATLDEARTTIESARVEPAPASALSARIAALPPAARRRHAVGPGPRRGRTARAAPDAQEPGRSPRPTRRTDETVVIREWRRGDGDDLRRLWESTGMRSIGDDDDGLATMARRNPGLVLVATVGGEIVGSALGAWDGRRGWIYHLATAAGRRRAGIGRQLVARIEAGLRAVGCRKVNVIVADGNEEGMAFWASAGYTVADGRQLGRELGAEDREAG